MVDDNGAHEMIESNELAYCDLLYTAFVGLIGQFFEVVGMLVDAEIAVC